MISLVHKLRRTCYGLLALAVLAHATQSWSAEPVRTAQGLVQGGPARLAGVSAWLGIPYAAPPVGEMRWKPPMPPAAWTGVRAGDVFGSRCIQTNPFPDMLWNSAAESEDCLYLSVWAPEGATDLPVMVWIHGGGFLSGSGDEQRHDSSSLAARGVVVVTINYRLGVLGFLAHSGLSEESPTGVSGNYGMLDMLAALQWVQGNIAGFGGNPDNVTIFGESAGSFAVSMLMASPMARGLFHKAIGQSGAAFSGPGPGLVSAATQAMAEGSRFATTLGAKSPAELRALDAVRLRDAAAQGYNFGAYVDGHLLPDSADEIFADGEQNDVPLLVGWTSAEAKWVTQSLAEFEAAREKAFPGDRQRAAELYPASNDAEAYRMGITLASDSWITHTTWLWAEAQLATGKAPVYRYLFDQVLATPAGPVPADDPGAAHATDIPFTFDRLDYTGNPISEGDQATANLMGAYWTNFARSGDPNGPGLPQWPAYAADKGRAVMRLGEDAAASPEADRERHEFIEQQ